jgi:hypothetical protein
MGRVRAAGGPWLVAAYRATLGLLAIYGLWMVAIHVFLWTPLLRNLINEHQQTVHIEYHQGWSIWPGRVHIDGLVLTVQDHFQQFRLAIDELDTTVVLYQLPSRKFHAEKVRAKGITFAMRRRLPPGELTQDALRGLPLIDNMPPLPLMEIDAEDETPDSRYTMFSVWLQDIRGDDIRELWFDKLRLEGKAQVSGAFYLKPQREIYIAPGVLHIEPSTFHIADSDVAEAVRGDLTLRAGPLNPRHMTPLKFVHAASLVSDLRGHLRGLEVAGLEGGAGDLHVEARVKDGKLAPGNRIEVELGETGLAQVETKRLSILVEEKHALIALHKVTAPGATLQLARAELFGDAPDLADLQPPRSMSLDLKNGTIQDAASLTAKLPKAMRLLGGRGTFSAHLEGPASNGAGFVKLDLAEASIDARNETFRTDLAVDARINSFDFRQGANLSDTTIDLQNGGIKRDPQARLWWGHIKLPRAQLRFQNSEMIDADLVADCRDARPIVGLYARTGSLPGSMKQLFTMDGLHVWGSAAAGKGWVVLRELHAAGDGAQIRAVYRHEKAGDQGAAWIKVGIIPLALGVGQNGGGLHVIHPGDFYTEKQAALGKAPMLLPRKPRPKR